VKPSRYNVIINVGREQALIFNGASGALAEVDVSSLPTIERLLESGGNITDDSDRPLLQGLTQGRYLVDDDLDEIQNLKERSDNERFDNKTLLLTIAPTLACNFRCDYCFENHTASRMTEETERALIRFAQAQLENSDGILVTWFGGEPTLTISTIERLQKRLNHLAAARRARIYPSSIITNGYLLDRPMAKTLKDLGITLAQVTLDGDRMTHDSRRKLADGRGTFDRIIDNLCDTADLINITVRINVDKNNADESLKIMEILRERGIIERLGIYFAPVNSAGNACGSIRDRCFTDEEFSRLLVRQYRGLMEMGISRVEYPQTFSGGMCGAVSERSFVISPEGFIFLCWEELSGDNARAVGNIFSSQISPAQLSNRLQYLAWNPFRIAECRDCRVLPVCMGGCPSKNINGNNDGRRFCSPYKYNLEEMLVLRYNCYLKGKEVIK